MDDVTRSLSDSSSATTVGRFTYRPASDEWTWSAGMFRIHGLEPGSVAPTSDLVNDHIHPADRAAARASRDEAIEQGKPFTFPHRVITAAGEQRVVIAAGHSDQDGDGACLTGHLIDVTEFRRDAADAAMDDVVEEFKSHRAVIEQAKGVLMQLYSVDSETAWLMLRAYSQAHNQKIRRHAEVLVDAAAQNRSPSKEQRGTIYEVLDQILDDQPEPG